MLQHEQPPVHVQAVGQVASVTDRVHGLGPGQSVHQVGLPVGIHRPDHRVGVAQHVAQPGRHVGQRGVGAVGAVRQQSGPAVDQTGRRRGILGLHPVHGPIRPAA